MESKYIGMVVQAIKRSVVLGGQTDIQQGEEQIPSKDTLYY